MKLKIVIISIGFLIISMLLCGCNDTANIETNESTSVVEDSRYIIDVLYDRHRNPIQKSVYDTYSGYMYIYTFTYAKESLDFVCKTSSITILDAEGNIIS